MASGGTPFPRPTPQKSMHTESLVAFSLHVARDRDLRSSHLWEAKDHRKASLQASSVQWGTHGEESGGKIVSARYPRKCDRPFVGRKGGRPLCSVGNGFMDTILQKRNGGRLQSPFWTGSRQLLAQVVADSAASHRPGVTVDAPRTVCHTTSCTSRGRGATDHPWKE